MAYFHRAKACLQVHRLLLRKYFGRQMRIRVLGSLRLSILNRLLLPEVWLKASIVCVISCHVIVRQPQLSKQVLYVVVLIQSRTIGHSFFELFL